MAPAPGPGGPPPGGGLRRQLGLGQAALTGIGVILGAGVYALVAPAAARAGNALWLAFLLAGVVAGLTAYSYARLGRMRPKNSPEFQYTALAFGPRVGFVAGWLMLAADLLAAAAVALGFGGYLSHLTGTPVVGGALGLLGLVTVFVYAGIGEAVGLAIVLTVVEVVGLVFVVAVGLPAWGAVDYLERPHGFGGVWDAASLIFFAYLGFDEMGNFAEEMRQPERDLPRALGISMVVTTLAYVLVAVSAVSAVGWRDLAGSPAPLAVVAGRALGPKADALLAWAALAATANTVLLTLVAASRSVYGMAAAAVLPRGLARVGRTAVPARAAAVVLAVTAGLVLLGDLARVAAFTDAAVLASFILVNLSLPWLAWRRPDGGRPGTGPLDVALPGSAALLCAWLLVHTGWLAVAAAGALAAVGVLVGRRAPGAS
jgi:APA family basic amino acid/polyamine antiporter